MGNQREKGEIARPAGNEPTPAWTELTSLRPQTSDLSDRATWLAWKPGSLATERTVGLRIQATKSQCCLGGRETRVGNPACLVPAGAVPLAPIRVDHAKSQFGDSGGIDWPAHHLRAGQLDRGRGCRHRQRARDSGVPALNGSHRDFG